MTKFETFLLFTYFSPLIGVWIYLGYHFCKSETGADFKKGDAVKAFGNVGVVKDVSVNGYVTVKFDDFDSTVVFNKDGRLMKWHKEVSLKHV